MSATACHAFLAARECVREQYQLCVYGFVIVPEHVHLLVNEPERGTLAQAMQSLKQGVARRLALRAAESFWQARDYDFNVWSHRKFSEKLSPLWAGIFPTVKLRSPTENPRPSRA